MQVSAATPSESPEAARARRLRQLGDYVRVLADRMGLRDWTFEVDEIGPAGDADEIFAVLIDWATGRPRATLGFGPAFHALETPEERRQWVACKLVLCHQAYLAREVDGARCSRYQKDGLRDQANLAAATIAEAWAPCLPLPLAGLMEHADRAEA